MLIPKTLGACADKLLDLRELQAKAQKEVDKIKKEIEAIETHVIQKLPALEAEGVLGRYAKVCVKVQTIPTVENWDEYYANILATKDFSFLHKKAGTKAILERWEAGETVPGTGKFIKKTVSVTKR
jgi:hypothetical protein